MMHVHKRVRRRGSNGKRQDARRKRKRNVMIRRFVRRRERGNERGLVVGKKPKKMARERENGLAGPSSLIQVDVSVVSYFQLNNLH
jgi:hypothetical protein